MMHPNDATARKLTIKAKIHSMQAATAELKGLVAATVTPTNADGSINPDMIPLYKQMLLRDGVKSVFANGTTGEWCSFTLAERKTLAEKWVAESAGLDHLFIHLGALAIDDAKELGRHAERTVLKALYQHSMDGTLDRAPTYAVACLAPSYFKPTTVDELVAYIKEVAASAPHLPFLYYHIPGLTGVQIPDMKAFLGKCVAEIPSFAGVKASTPTLPEVYPMLDYARKPLAVAYGVDEQLLAGLAVGVPAAVGSFYNFVGAEYNRLIADFQENNDVVSARRRQHKLAGDILPLFQKYSTGVAKVVTSMIYSAKLGRDVDMGPARLPLKRLTDADLADIRAVLQAGGYLGKQVSPCRAVVPRAQPEQDLDIYDMCGL